MMSGPSRNPSLLPTIIIGIVCSVAASILYDKLIPFLFWMSTNISKIVNSLHSGFIDKQYERASFSDSGRMQIFISLLLLSIVIYLAVDRANGFYYNRVSLPRGIHTILLILTRVTAIINISFMYFMIIFSFIIISGDEITVEARKIFTHTMALEAPFMTQQQVLDFNRRWSLIASKNDYDSIMNDLYKMNSSLEKR